MEDEKHLSRIRRELARSPLSEQEIYHIIEGLVDTDWAKFRLQDEEPCDNCRRSIPYRQIIKFYSEGTKRYCQDCYKMPIERRCPNCGKSHHNHRDGSYWCKDCRTSPCVSCKEIFIWGYPDGLHVCTDCRKAQGIDENRIRKESHKLSAHSGRAKANNLPNTLSLSDWFASLIDFNWICAYCLTNPYDNLDHFIPICKGGGTTKQNCIPACKECNDLKAHRHPDTVKSIPQESLIRVYLYLSSK